MVIKPDSYYLVKNGTPEVVKQRTTPTLVKTGEKELILDHPCEIYRTEDRKLTVWVSSKMPSSINAGLPLVIPIGAILKYELQDKSQKITSMISKLTNVASAK